MSSSHKITFVSNEEQLKIEPMKGIDKISLINDTKIFDHPQFQGEIYKKLLTKLIYGFHQGIMFSHQEQDVIFFRVTKLFQQNDPGLRTLIYKSLKILRVEKYVHIILQSLIKDFMNSNQIVRVEALRLISTISEEEHIIQIEKFVQQNTYISSTALLAGIKLVNKFPHIVKKWQPEIYFVLSQSQSINYHALILLYEIIKNDRIPAVDYLKFPCQPQLQLVNLQILKFLKNVSLSSDSKEIYNQENVLFLNYSINSGQNLELLETYSIILQNRDLQNIYSDHIHQQFLKIFYHNHNFFEVYRGVKLLGHAIKIFGSTEISILRIHIEMATLHPNISVSGISIFICLQLNRKQQQITYLKYLFNLLKKQQDLQHNFLEGLIEQVDLHPEYLLLAINFLQSIRLKGLNSQIKISAMKIINHALFELINYRYITLKILFGLSQPSEIQIQFQTILMICSICFQIESKLVKQLDISDTPYCFEYLKNNFKNGSDAFCNDQSQEFKLMKQQLLEIIQNVQRNYSHLIDSQGNQENIYENNELKLLDWQQTDQDFLLPQTYGKFQMSCNNYQIK